MLIDRCKMFDLSLFEAAGIDNATASFDITVARCLSSLQAGLASRAFASVQDVVSEVESTPAFHAHLMEVLMRYLNQLTQATGAIFDRVRQIAASEPAKEPMLSKELQSSTLLRLTTTLWTAFYPFALFAPLARRIVPTACSCLQSALDLARYLPALLTGDEAAFTSAEIVKLASQPPSEGGAGVKESRLSPHASHMLCDLIRTLVELIARSASTMTLGTVKICVVLASA